MILFNETTKWQGVCLDTGSRTTVIGLPQAKAYCRYVCVKFKTKKNRPKCLSTPFVVDCTGRMLTAYNSTTELRQTYNAFQVKPYFRKIYTNLMDLKSNSDYERPFHIHYPKSLKDMIQGLKTLAKQSEKKLKT